MRPRYPSLRMKFAQSNSTIRFKNAPLFRAIAILVFVALLASSFYSRSSASGASTFSRVDGKVIGLVGNPMATASAAPFSVMASPFAETVETFKAGCVTPSTEFDLGEVVCAKITNAPTYPYFALRKITWVNTAGEILSEAEVTSSPQEFSFTLPSGAISPEGIDRRGGWAVNSVSTSDSSIRAEQQFTVKDPTAAAANMMVYEAVQNGDAVVAAGSNVTYNVMVANRGPNAAANVVLTKSGPTMSDGMLSAATFVSWTQLSGPTFTVPVSTSDTERTIASLPAGSVATFAVTYQVNSGTPNYTEVTDTSTVASATADPRTTDNSSFADATVLGVASSQPCVLTCPANVVVTANATQGSQEGAFVSYPAASGVGDCGTVRNTPPSRDEITGDLQFLAVGVHTITSSAETGPTCTFTVTVLDTDVPTISCPASVTVTAPVGTEEATVNPGTPTTNVVGGTVVGVRSDGSPALYDDDGNVVTPAVVVPLNAPYPVGVTGILWTVTDADGRKATCAQTIKVNAVCGTDTEAPTIVAPPDVTVGTGPDNLGCVVALDDELGQAAAQDNCTASITVSGIPANNEFVPGVYTITYTATDGVGLTATDTQIVTVVDDTPPHIAAPVDATYTCLGDVPAASPSQATRGVVLDANGNPLPPGPPLDNCGVPTVTVTETVTGAGSAASPKIISRVFTATDSAGNSSSSTQTITVIDSTPPNITAPANVTAYTGPGATTCDTVVSNATLGTASASDNCAGVTVTRSPAGNTFAEGPTTITWTATDAAGNTTTANQTVTVIDNTVPTVTAPAAVTLYTGVGATLCGVNVANLNATLGTGSASDNCPGVGAVTRSGVPAGNTFPLGNTTVTYSATDAHGNSSSATQVVTVIDNTPPVITPPANIVVQLPLNSTATSMVVNYPNPATATDNCAGTITIGYSPASGSTFPVGPTTVTVTATDAHSNSSTATFTVTVLYNFTGFFSPVNNVPTLNAANAGKNIPVKFSLSGNKGLGIMAVDSPYSVSFNCATNDPGVDIVETNQPGQSTLTYSPDTYHYNWKTESSWAGTCRQLVVKLNDGSLHVANFKFK